MIMEKKVLPDDSNSKQGQRPLGILMNPEIQKGIYSNVAIIHHTENEFIIDFLMRMGYEGQLVSRVILSPEHMNALSKAIADNITKFNAKKAQKNK